MKILYLANQRMPTDKAYGFQIAKMCQAFAENGHEVELVFPTRGTAPYSSLFEYYGIPEVFKVAVIFSPDLRWPAPFGWLAFHLKNYLSARKLVRHALSSKADLIYSRDELPLALLNRTNKQLMYEAHKYSSSRRILYRILKNNRVPLVVISEGLKEKFQQFGFSRINVAHDGVDLGEFDLAMDQDACRRELKLPLDKTLIGYVGQLRTLGMEKGITELIEAAKELPPPSCLVIVGGTPADIEFYKEYALRKGMGDRVLFTGFQKHRLIPRYLKAMNLLVMPFPNIEHYARFMSPLKLFEYMASKKPIVATDLPTVREVLNRENSVLVRPDSALDLAAGIRQLIADPALAKRLAEQAYEDVRGYSWIRRAQTVLEFARNP